MKLEDAVDITIQELSDATDEFGPFASAHEGYAVLLEELTELFDAIRDKKCGVEEMKMEAKQVGAMAIRFLIDIC